MALPLGILILEYSRQHAVEREEDPEGPHSDHLRSSRWETCPYGRQCRSVQFIPSVGLAHVGCNKIFPDLSVHTSCTRRLLTG